MTTAPAICAHKKVTCVFAVDPAIWEWPPRWRCKDCHHYVKPAAFVLESQPLPNELALMDFAARLGKP